MLSIFVKILRNKYFLRSAIFTALLFIFFNIGLILNIPNFLNIAPNIVDYLSNQETNEITLSLFTALITIFILFFAFVQFSLSRSNLPGDIIRKYIIEDENSYRYIGHQFSFAIILGCFTVLSPNIHKLNIILCVMTVLVSIFYSLVYFFWIVNNVSAIGIFKIILKKLKLDEINRIEKEAFSGLSKFNDLLETSTLNIKVTSSYYLDLFISDHYRIYSERRGLIKSIDINKIDALLVPHKDMINKIIIDVNVGEYIPKFEPLSERTPKTTLMRIEKKITQHKGDDAKHKEFDRKFEETEIHRKLIDCFHTEESVYKNNLSFIEDLLYFFINAIEKESTEADKLLELFTSFIVDNVELPEDNIWVKEIGLSENLFLKIILLMEENVRAKEIDNNKLELLLTFIYSFRNLAVKHKSFKLLSAVLDLAQLIFYKIVSDSNRYNSRISIIILHLQEISFSTIVYGFPEPSIKDFCKYWSSFYYPLIKKTINSAISSFYIMIKYYHRRDEQDNHYNLIPNAQSLINLLSPLNHYKPLDELSFSHPNIYTKKEKEIIYSYAKDLVYISIFLFFKAKRDKLPNWLILDIAFPICENCNTTAKYKYDAIEILGDLFFGSNFNYPHSSFLSQEFELNKVHESGGYSPFTINFDLFWFMFSYYHKINNNKFFPNEIKSKTNYTMSRINTYKKQIDNYKSDFILNLFNITVEQFDQFITEYKIHIDSIIKNANEKKA